MRPYLPFAALVVIALAGCGGRTVGLPASAGAPAATLAPQQARTQFIIIVPVKTVANRKLRPRYISASTQSLNIVVSQGATQVVNQTVNLTPTSAGCSSTLASTQCVLTLALSPGSYSVVVTTYDQLNAGGNLLSSGQNVAVTIVQGLANTVALTLSGVPARFLVAADGVIVTGNATTGFSVPGITTQPQPFTAIARDADGSYIVGAGAPALTFSVTSGAGWITTNPTTTLPNAFTVASPGSGKAATIALTAAYSDATCSQPTAVCTASFAVANHAQTLFVASCGATGCGNGSDTVKVFAPPYTGTPTTITSTISGPYAMALDWHQNLYVTNLSSGQTTMTVPPYTAPAPYGHFSVGQTIGVVVDAGLTLWESAYGGNVYEYPVPYRNLAAQTITTSAPNPPSYLDLAGNLWVADTVGQAGIVELAPPTFLSRTARFSTGAQPGCFKVGPDETVYAVVPSTGSAFISHPPYSSLITTSLGTPYDVTFDQLGHEFTADLNNDISEWDSGGNPIMQITNGISYSFGTMPNCQVITTDAAGDLFSLNNGSNTVTVYAPPYSGTPITVTGFPQPQALLLAP
jgi:hypothetical protein